MLTLRPSHKSIIAYLSSNNLLNTAAALRDELKIGDTFDASKSEKYEGLLEKKWTIVVRLQKKVDSASSRNCRFPYEPHG
jgi:platelet-activating factor acetylhydrolase IB subunit alpha